GWRRRDAPVRWIEPLPWATGKVAVSLCPLSPHSQNGPVTELNRPEFLGDFPVLFHAAANAACSGSGLIPTSESWRSGKRGRSLIRFRRTPQRSPLLAVVVEHGG